MQIGVVLALVALGLGWVMEVGLWAHRAGPGWLALTAVAAGATLVLRRRLERQSGAWPLWLWGCAFANAGALALYDGKVLHALGPWVLSGTLVVAVYWSLAGPAPLEALVFPGSMSRMLNFFGMAEEIGPGLREVPLRLNEPRLWGRVALGALLALPMLLLFATLFALADPVFNEQLGNGLVQSFHWLGPVGRVALFSLFLLGLLRYFARRAGPGEVPAAPGQADPVILGVALGSLNLLFASFLAVQARYLFGQVPLADMSYAEYARRGFFELVTATLLVLAIVFVFYQLLYRRPGAGFSLGLMAVLILETFGLAASAIKRMHLYIDAYGLTLTRAYVEMALAGICLTLALVLIALARRPSVSWLAARLVLLFLLSLAAAGLVDVERVVADVNVSRAGQAHIDVFYLGGLSADALPAVERLLSHRDPGIRQEALMSATRIRERLAGRTWQEWNLSSYRAMKGRDSLELGRLE